MKRMDLLSAPVGQAHGTIHLLLLPLLHNRRQGCMDVLRRRLRPFVIVRHIVVLAKVNLLWVRHICTQPSKTCFSKHTV